MQSQIRTCDQNNYLIWMLIRKTEKHTDPDADPDPQHCYVNSCIPGSKLGSPHVFFVKTNNKAVNNNYLPLQFLFQIRLALSFSTISLNRRHTNTINQKKKALHLVHLHHLDHLFPTDNFKTDHLVQLYALSAPMYTIVL
jgi:hypothetical protein